MKLITRIPENLGEKERVTDTHVYFLRGPLSQWFNSPFLAQDFISDIMGFTGELHSFSNTEQYMMYNKAIFMNDIICAKEILNSGNPKEIKALGRSVTNYDEALWNTVRFYVVTVGNIYKFRDNHELYEYIQKTGDRVIVEANPQDSIWAVGLAEDNDDILDESKWKGQNLLGKALMYARDGALLPEFYKRLHNSLDDLLRKIVSSRNGSACSISIEVKRNEATDLEFFIKKCRILEETVKAQKETIKIQNEIANNRKKLINEIRELAITASRPELKDELLKFFNEQDANA